MAETIRGGKWHCRDMQLDLERAGAHGINVDPEPIKENMYHGSYRGSEWIATWIKDKGLMLSFPEYNKIGRELIGAFACVVEYDPFCMYTLRGTRLKVTVEWARHDQDQEYEHIKRANGVENLRRLSNVQIN